MLDVCVYKSKSQPRFRFPRTSWVVMKAVANRNKAKSANVELTPIVSNYVLSLEKEHVSCRGQEHTFHLYNLIYIAQSYQKDPCWH